MKKIKAIFAAVFAAVLTTGMSGCKTTGSIVSEEISVRGRTFEKTGEVCVIPKGKTAIVEMKDDSSWSSFVSENTDEFAKGVFLKDRKVKLHSFVMAQYPVTREFYKAVMGFDPSTVEADNPSAKRINPVNNVNWLMAAIFCNKLSELEGLEPVYFCTIDGVDETNPEKWIAAGIVLTRVPPSDVFEDYKNYSYIVKTDISKNGYRMPTEAEWEFAAHGGNVSEKDWTYAFSGTPAKEGVLIEPYESKADENLSEVGWYSDNSFGRTHAVGTKKPNRLNIYDMSGNVWEWCNDYENSYVTKFDKLYIKNGYVENPMGPDYGNYRIQRGGGALSKASDCSVANRLGPYGPDRAYGIRLVRTIN